MNIIPLGDRILVRRAAPQTVVREGNASSDAVPDASARGVVVAAGTGRCGHDGTDIPLGIRAGDTIVFALDAARELTLGGVEYWIMHADDVLIVEIRAAPLWTRRPIEFGRHITARRTVRSALVGRCTRSHEA